MKKFISLFLCLLLAFSCFAFCVGAQQSQELQVIVATDLHLDLESCKAETVENTNPVNSDFAHASNGGQLHYESEAIIDGFLKSAAQSDSEYVLLAGDLTHHGSQQEHVYLAQMFSQFEAQSGKKIYLVPGNHDLRESTIEQFRQYYAPFGYNQALETDEATGSYTVDLDSEYRLIAINSACSGKDGHAVTTQLMDWIKAQGEKAKQDGKNLVAMLHHNILEHVILTTALNNGYVISEEELDIANVFASLGIKYTFTGHTHHHDIASFESEEGAVIYAVLTSSMNAYPCPYRTVTFGEKVKIETNKVEKIDTSMLPGGISDAAMNMAQTNFSEYARICTYSGIEHRLGAVTTADGLITLLKIEDEQIKAILQKVGDRLEKILNTPLYEKDAETKGDSIEAYAKMYKTTLPATEHKTILKMLTYFYQSHAEGDENIPSYSADVIALTRAVAVGINYTLAELSGEEYAQILSFALESLAGFGVPVNFLKYAGDGIKRFEGCEIFVTTAVIPVIGEFGTDDGPADNNVTLPGYGELNENNDLTFFETLMQVVRKIIEIVRTLFSLLPAVA